MNNLNGPDSIKKGDFGYSSETLSGDSRKKTRNSSGKAAAQNNIPTSRPTNRQNRQAKRDSKKLRNSTILGIFLLLIQLALSGYFVYSLMNNNFDFITDAIFIGIMAGLVLLLIIVFIMECGKKLKTKRAGKVISIIVSLALLAGIYFSSPWGTMSGAKVDESPFVVYLTASDTFGNFDKKTNQRSDTNIMCAVNPKTHTVMMVSIPRDYYIPVIAKSVSINTSLNSDKLTHIGLYGNGQAYSKTTGKKLSAADWQYACEAKWGYGKNVLMDSLKRLLKFNTDKDHYHYAQINFTGFADLIDEMGGITVDVKKNFHITTYDSYKEDNGKRTRYDYKKGKMDMDGKEALTYARARKQFAEGDIQRNKNQADVIRAMSEKATSPTILLRYRGIVNAIQNCVETDIDLSSMVSLQQKVNGHKNFDGWNTVSFSLIGTAAGGRMPVLWDGSSLYVLPKNGVSVNYANKLLNKALAGTDSKTLQKLSKQYTAAQGE